MKQTNVPHSEVSSPMHVLEFLIRDLPNLTPELKKSATYVLENPNEIGVSSIREIALKAKVKPNSLVRMARKIGFDGYEDFRQPFRDQIRRGEFEYRDQQSPSGGWSYRTPTDRENRQIPPRIHRARCFEARRIRRIFWSDAQSLGKADPHPGSNRGRLGSCLVL